MKKLLLFFGLFLMVSISGCKECSVETTLVIPQQQLVITDQDGDNLLFGDSAIYNPDSIQFIHSRLGALEFDQDAQGGLILLEFPITENRAENIQMVLDANNSNSLDYNTLVFVNNKCEREYNLSYVNLDGVQVCGSCGNSEFNSDTKIYLAL